MATVTLTAAAPAIPLVAGMILRLEAVHATTGAAVAGVSASAWSIYGNELSVQDGGGTIGDTGPYMLVPGPAPLESSPIKITGGL